MCNVVKESIGIYDSKLVPFRLYKITQENYGGALSVLQTRAKSGHVLLCKHEDSKWELTPELKEGEVLEVPLGAELQVVTPEEWKEISAANG
jgi:hypothetical protein